MSNIKYTMGDDGKVNPMEIVIILWITIFVTMLGIGLIAPLMSIYAKELGASNFEIGIIFGSFAIARTIAQIPIGSLSDKYGKKIFILIGTFFYGIFTLMYAFINSVSGLLLVRLFNGAFSSFITPVAGAYVATIAPREKLGEYMGIFNSSISVGFAMGPLIGGFLAEWYGIKTPFYFCGALAFLAFLISYFKLKNVVVDSNGKWKYISECIVRKEVEFSKSILSFEFLKNRYFLISYIINTAYMAVNAGIIGYLAVYASNYNIGIAYVGFLIASTNLVMGTLQRKFGRIYDKVGNSVIYIGLIIGGFGVYALSISNSPISMFISLVVMALGGAMYVPAINALAMNDIPHYKKGGAMGFFTTSLNIGMFIGAVVLGFIADYVGLSNMYKFSAVILCGVCIGAYIAMRKRI
ncbi:MFS transporter [Methanothermococcus sp.]|uniref:MFS transporter n=1 Tax=Methanothermococcus sp. TaxID=2614238 RepID=UPI0025FD555A|nr:MFS transporter [Methanothermococcus sp.]